MYGFRVDEAQGRSHRFFFHDSIVGHNLFHLAKASGGALQNVDVRLRHRDGSAVWVSANLKFYHDEYGNFAGVEGTVRDITGQVIARGALQKNRELLKLSQKIAHIGSWELHHKNGQMTWSEETYRIFGINPTRTPACLEALLNSVHPDDRQRINKAFKQPGSASQQPLTHRLQLPDGSIHYVEERFRTEFDADGRPNRSVGTVQDITERHLLQNELAEKQELMIAQSRSAAMGEMISMIAHQWRQPISVIAMEANNIIADIELDSLETDVLRDEARHILAQTSHLSQTIDDFRNFFRPTKSKEPVLVSTVMKEALAIMAKSFEHNSVAIQTDFDVSTTIHTYTRELLQCFLNLLKNAKDELENSSALPRTIVIRIFETQTSIVTEVSDNGSGIDNAIIRRIFEPYFSTKEVQNGTGLGLYMVKTIVEKHLGGTIHAENISGGARFSVSLPKENPDQAVR